MKQHLKRTLSILSLAVALLLGMSTVAFAQEVTGSIVGTVTDANGAALKGATVTITDSAKNVVVRTLVTDDDGAYTARDLPVATYDVSVEAANFKRHLESKVHVDVG
ncbi:MAG: carboxypeptidase-like regulatory domain-containing protein, partial [Pyrinomonadaceae bacterium]